MEELIHNRGRGPEIKGTRITVYDILDYRGRHPTEQIAEWLNVTVQQVEAAYAYIDANRAEVLDHYGPMLARCKRGNPPDVQARLVSARERTKKRLEDLAFTRPNMAKGAARLLTHIAEATPKPYLF